MSKKTKKAMSMLLVVTLIAVIAVGGMLAYLTSEDADVNVMALGNVKIEQIEQERDATGNLVDFTQTKPAYPAVGPIAWAEEGVVVNGTEYKVFTDELKNVVDKIVTVNNVGKSDAYIRTVVAIEAPDGDPNDLIHYNWNDTDTEQKSAFVTKIDGVDYYIVEFVYKEALAAGAKSAPSLMQVFLDAKTTSEDCAKFNGEWKILVKSQAVQTEGFADAKTALDTAFGEVTANNHPWSNKVIVETNDEAELLGALANGKEVILSTDIVEIHEATFNGNGTEVILAGVGGDSYGYLAFVPGKGKDTTVENLTATGSGFVEVGHYGEGGGNYKVNNLTVKDMNATLAVNNGGNNIAAAFAHYGTAELNDCVMTGTRTAVEGYVAYDAAFVNGTKTTINGGEYGSIYLANQAHVTIKNAKVDEITSCAITAGKLGKLTIGAGTEVGTIRLTPGSYTPALVIEDGAKVGAIEYKGVTYTQAEWLAR